MAKIDTAKVCKKTHDHLRSLGFSPRDADGSDLGHPNSLLRFKVGTAYSEVSATVWKGIRQIAVCRVSDSTKVEEFLNQLTEYTRRNIFDLPKETI